MTNPITTPKELVGREAEDYGSNKGTIIAAEYVKDYKKLLVHDHTGWLDEEAIEEYEFSDDTILVAFKESENGDVNVFEFSGAGVTLI